MSRGAATRRMPAVLAAVLAVIAIGGWLIWRGTRAEAQGTQLPGNGTIEADEIEIGAQRSARLARYAVEEGQPVKAGDVIAVLDTSELAAQLIQAQGTAEAASSKLQELVRGTRKEQVKQASARVSQTQAALSGAQRTLTNAQRDYSHLTPLKEALDSAETQRRANLSAVQHAEAALEGAKTAEKTAKEDYETGIPVKTARDNARQQLEAALAAQRTANANLDQLLNGSRSEDLRAAEARSSQASANLDAAREEYRNADVELKRAKTLHEGNALSDQALETAVTKADTARAKLTAAQQAKSEADSSLDKTKTGARKEEIESARGAAQQAQANVEGSKRAVENAEQSYGLRLDTRGRLENATTQRQIAESQLATAQANLAGAELAVKHARTALNDRLMPKQSVDTGLQQYETAVGQLEEAQAKLEEMRNGARPEEIAQARGQLRQARGALELARVQQQQSIIRAPSDGVVTEHVAKVGEVMIAGATVVKLVPLDKTYLTLYVPLTELGKVKLGQRVDVTTDTYRGKTYQGEVTRISDTPEFTPRNVQTQDERVKLVFQVRVDIQNSNRELKPGMPADAKIHLQ